MPSCLRAFAFFFAGWLLWSCSISYNFKTQSTIDYTKTKSISIQDFPNVAQLVNASLAQKFSEALKDKYTKQTKLNILRSGGDLNLEGEITGYSFTPMAVREDMFASQTRLTITVRVRFTDNNNAENDLEQTFSAKQEFDNSKTIGEVEDELCELIIKEIVDLIFNETVAKW